MIKLTQLTACALALFCLFSCQSNSQQNHEAQTTGTLALAPPDYTHFITKDSANKMLQSYLTSISGSSTDSLQSLILDADALRTYLSDTSIKEVKVMFAHTLDYINSGHGGQYTGFVPNALTIVIAGFDAEGNYIYAPGTMVPDHAKPCPENCPTAGTAVSSTLQ